MACMLALQSLYLHKACIELINYDMSIIIMMAVLSQNSCSLNDSQKNPLEALFSLSVIHSFI